MNPVYNNRNRYESAWHYYRTRQSVWWFSCSIGVSGILYTCSVRYSFLFTCLSQLKFFLVRCVYRLVRLNKTGQTFKIARPAKNNEIRHLKALILRLDRYFEHRTRCFFTRFGSNSHHNSFVTQRTRVYFDALVSITG